MTDYKGFYEAMVEHAEDFENVVLGSDTLGLTDREAELLHDVARTIVAAAEEHVPGGYHTEIFNITIKEEA